MNQAKGPGVGSAVTCPSGYRGRCCDPGSHTAVAIDDGETQLARLRVRTSRGQTDQLPAWASPFEQRTWAVESADGPGFPLAGQLVAAGERVLDVPAT